MVTSRSEPRAYMRPLIAFDSPSLCIAASSRVPTVSDAPVVQTKHVQTKQDLYSTIRPFISTLSNVFKAKTEPNNYLDHGSID